MHENKMTMEGSKMITALEAGRWLARMAAADGVVSPNERALLKEFAETYGLDTKYLYRTAHAISNCVEDPEVEYYSSGKMKGKRFEEFVVSLCVNKAIFELLSWRGDKTSGEIYAKDSLLPDLLIRHKLEKATVEYFVECKYRSTIPEEGLDISTQIERYKKMTNDDKNREIFVALGVGGSSSAPESLYIIPVRMIKIGIPIKLDKIKKCLCNPINFHGYINHYYEKRIFKSK